MTMMWCGDVQAYDKFRSLSLNPPAEYAKLPMQSASAFESPGYGLPPLAVRAGNVAVVTVAGSLISGSAGWRRIFGMVGYEDIKGAIMDAVADEDTEAVVVYYDTPGGAVNGIEGTAELIAEAGKYVPIVGYAATAASAGYWLASTAEYLVAPATGVLGSIGTIAIYSNQVEAAAKEGIKYHVFKSGELKMAGNPYEEMSDKVKASLQMQIDDMTSEFYRQVSKYRGRDATEMRQLFGDGRSVLGMRAYAGGLIDEIGSLKNAVAKAKQLAQAKQTAAKLRTM